MDRQTRKYCTQAAETLPVISVDSGVFVTEIFGSDLGSGLSSGFGVDLGSALSSGFAEALGSALSSGFAVAFDSYSDSVLVSGLATANGATLGSADN